MQRRLSYPTETVLSNKITSNRMLLSFKDSPRKPLRRRPYATMHGVFLKRHLLVAVWRAQFCPTARPSSPPPPSGSSHSASDLLIEWKRRRFDITQCNKVRRQSRHSMEDGRTVRRIILRSIVPLNALSPFILAAAHIEGERRRNQEERSIDIYFGKGVAGKKLLHARRSQCLGNERTVSLRKPTDRYYVFRSHDRRMTGALIDNRLN